MPDNGDPSVHDISERLEQARREGVEGGPPKGIPSGEAGEAMMAALQQRMETQNNLALAAQLLGVLVARTDQMEIVVTREEFDAASDLEVEVRRDPEIDSIKIRAERPLDGLEEEVEPNESEKL